MRVLVTGGAGFIGSHVVDRLIAADARVLVVDDLSTGVRRNVPSGVEMRQHDLARPGTDDLIKEWRPDAIIHCAAQASVSKSIRDPVADARSNILGTIALTCGAAASGCGRIVYVTTGGALYGEPLYLPCDEAHRIAPLNPYGLSKWVGERYLELLAPSAMVRVVLRLANIYGPRQRPEGEAGVVSIFANRMRRREPVEIHGDGAQTRDFVFVGDAADAIVAGLTCRDSITANIGTGSQVSIRQLFDTLAVISGYELPAQHTPPRQGDIRHSALSTETAKARLGWSARMSLAEGLQLTYEAAAADGPEGETTC